MFIALIRQIVTRRFDKQTSLSLKFSPASPVFVIGQRRNPDSEKKSTNGVVSSENATTIERVFRRQWKIVNIFTEQCHDRAARTAFRLIETVLVRCCDTVFHRRRRIGESLWTKSYRSSFSTWDSRGSYWQRCSFCFRFSAPPSQIPSHRRASTNSYRSSSTLTMWETLEEDPSSPFLLYVRRGKWTSGIVVGLNFKWVQVAFNDRETGMLRTIKMETRPVERAATADKTNATRDLRCDYSIFGSVCVKGKIENSWNRAVCIYKHLRDKL